MSSQLMSYKTTITFYYNGLITFLEAMEKTKLNLKKLGLNTYNYIYMPKPNKCILFIIQDFVIIEIVNPNIQIDS